jgi:hypothetical protein
LLGGLAALLLAGCASGQGDIVTSSLQMPTVSGGLGTSDTYARIARGANTCWFGANGPLRYTHIFHADAKPASKGGEVDITIHERVVGKPSPLGFVAFKVAITGSESQSEVTVNNNKFPQDVGQLMRADVEAWSRGGRRCSGAEIAALLRPASGMPLPDRRPGRPRRKQ